MDHPGHYFRRLKSVSISLPCIAGPYTSVSAKFSLGANRYRKSKIVSDGYKEIAGTDERFAYNTNAVQSIATSSAQNDSGIFELNFRDERYLPFEGCGAISSWELNLPSVVKQFDYNTISDVILHIKYTARDGGEPLNGGEPFKKVVNDSLIGIMNDVGEELAEHGLHIALNMKHDLTNKWHLLKKNGTVELLIDKSRFPYMVQPFDTHIESVVFFAKLKDNPANFILTTESPSETTETRLEKMEKIDLYNGTNDKIILNTSFNLSVAEADKLEELILVVKYAFGTT
jgi:hypothetical protein